MHGVKQSTILSLFLLGLLTVDDEAGAAGYAGTEVCARCHAEQYNDFRVSGHPYKLSRAEDASKRPIPLPQGYAWGDISYVIGGVRKKVRYMDRQGYIITAAKDGSELKTQYNLETGTWSFYHKGEKKPYDCGTCHTTGYKKNGQQDGLPGIKGTWAEPGIQCEACHGPGGEHVRKGDKKKITVDRSSALCGGCHIRGSKDKIPAKGGFIRHHEQYNELLTGSHKDLDCVACHNPHKRSEFSIKSECSACHTLQASAYQGSTMEQVGVRCMDCHMPRAVKSAVARGKHEGDIRTHLFAISTDAKAAMFYVEKENGKERTYAKGFVTLDFACLSCHANKDRKWAAAKAKGIHSYGK